MENIEVNTGNDNCTCCMKCAKLTECEAKTQCSIGYNEDCLNFEPFICPNYIRVIE